MMKYGYVNKFTAQSGKRDELVQILLQAAEALQSNQDCSQYLISTSNEAEAVYVSEIWSSKQAHDASLEPPEIKAVIAKAMPLIANIFNIAEQQIVGGKY